MGPTMSAKDYLRKGTAPVAFAVFLLLGVSLVSLIVARTQTVRLTKEIVATETLGNAQMGILAMVSGLSGYAVHGDNAQLGAALKKLAQIQKASAYVDPKSLGIFKGTLVQIRGLAGALTTAKVERVRTQLLFSITNMAVELDHGMIQPAFVLHSHRMDRLRTALQRGEYASGGFSALAFVICVFLGLRAQRTITRGLIEPMHDLGRLATEAQQFRVEPLHGTAAIEEIHSANVAMTGLLDVMFRVLDSIPGVGIVVTGPVPENKILFCNAMMRSFYTQLYPSLTSAGLQNLPKVLEPGLSIHAFHAHPDRIRGKFQQMDVNKAVKNMQISVGAATIESYTLPIGDVGGPPDTMSVFSSTRALSCGSTPRYSAQVPRWRR